MGNSNKRIPPPEDFDPSNICSTGPVYVRKKLYYKGHASTTYSVDQAISIMDWIGRREDSDDCMPFSVSLMEGEEIIAIAEDNGEFGCGEILSSCIKKAEGYNILVCVTRYVDGLFVADMVEAQKHRAVREAAAQAVELLLETLNNKK
eukprot:gene14242-19110_t